MKSVLRSFQNRRTLARVVDGTAEEASRADWVAGSSGAVPSGPGRAAREDYCSVRSSQDGEPAGRRRLQFSESQEKVQNGRLTRRAVGISFPMGGFPGEAWPAFHCYETRARKNNWMTSMTPDSDQVLESSAADSAVWKQVVVEYQK